MNKLTNPFWRERQYVRLQIPIEWAVDRVMQHLLPCWPFNKAGVIWSERVALECARGKHDERGTYWMWYWIAFYHGFNWERMRGRWWLRIYAIKEWIDERQYQ